MTQKLYAGIGARKTPPRERLAMFNAAQFLAGAGFTLRSGAALGADEAFEAGCDKAHGTKEIMLPWKLYNGSLSSFYEPSDQAYNVAMKFHPAWGNLTQGGQRLMARNAEILLGKDLQTPVQFVLCWTSGGAAIGGTGHSIRIAKAYQIPVLNMGSMSLPQIEEYLGNIIPELT